MNDLWSYLPDGGWPRFCCDVFWQSTFVGLLAWGLLRVTARRPALRAWLSLLALTSCLAIPLGAAALRSGGYGLIASAEPNIIAEAFHPRVALTGASASPVLALQDSAGFGAPDVDESPIGKEPLSWWSLAGIAWAAVSLFFAGRFLLSLLGLRRLQAGAVICRDQAVVAAAAHAARRVGLSKTPAVEVSSSVCCPMVLAFGRPRLFIPPPSVSLRTELDWLAIFCHELAHVRRGDGWGRLLGELVVVLLPWQPAVWLLRRAYHRACDEACDDWAVAAGADPIALASTLTGWIPQKVPMLAAGAIGSSNVRARVLRLLSLSERPTHRLGLVGRLGSVTIALILAATVAAAQVRQVESAPEPPRCPAERSDSKQRADQADRAPSKRAGLPAYRIEPPDVLQIELVMPVGKAPVQIREGERLRIAASVASAHLSIFGTFKLDSEGQVDLGTRHGPVRVLGLTPVQAQEAIKRHLSEALRDPEVMVLLSEPAGASINGPYLVGPDGAVNLRSYGIVYVAGKTLPEAEKAIEEHLAETLLRPDVSIDVVAYNSKVYYVIITGGGKLGDHVIRRPITGKETVLDAISQIGPTLRLSGKKIWVCRPNGSDEGKVQGQILPVDWEAITRRGSSNTNYQIMPGDRIFVADPSQSGEKAANGPSDAAPARR